jgi:hypothetical protein
MAVSRRNRLAVFLVVLGLAGGLGMPVVATPALADATCPSVDSVTGAVTPAPAPDVNWAGCDLKQANLSGADLEGADLDGANLTQANLSNVDLSGANLFAATLSNAGISGDLANADLATAAVGGLQLAGNLRSADLDGITGGGLNLAGGTLINATLDSADLDNSELSEDNFLGATFTGATDVSTLWTSDTCPDGASSAYFTDGCLTPIDVTTPSATPVVTGTAGSNGWYTSEVTVTWYWVDSNSLDAEQCPSTTTTPTGTQGIAVVVSASCTDGVGHVGQASVTEMIDTTPPLVTLTGVTKGGIYPFGLPPNPSCRTTDAYSGVADHAATDLFGGRPDGTGVVSAECEGATDRAGNETSAFTWNYQIVYAFGGFMAPAVGSTFKPSEHNISVRFVLTNVTGTPISASTAAALASTFDVRATLRGPGISPDLASCSWNKKSAYFQCVIVRPVHVRTGHSHPYSITVSENLGGGFVTAPIDYYSQNPAPYYFG